MNKNICYVIAAVLASSLAATTVSAKQLHHVKHDKKHHHVKHHTHVKYKTIVRYVPVPVSGYTSGYYNSPLLGVGGLLGLDSPVTTANRYIPVTANPAIPTRRLISDRALLADRYDRFYPVSLNRVNRDALRIRRDVNQLQYDLGNSYRTVPVGYYRGW